MDNKELPFYLPDDSITDMIAFCPPESLGAPATPDKRMSALLACGDGTIRSLTGNAVASKVQVDEVPTTLHAYGDVAGGLLYGTCSGGVGLVEFSDEAQELGWLSSPGGKASKTVCIATHGDVRCLTSSRTPRIFNNSRVSCDKSTFLCLLHRNAPQTLPVMAYARSSQAATMEGCKFCESIRMVTLLNRLLSFE